jgi:nucleotide-binding universal stress UspA family protein
VADHVEVTRAAEIALKKILVPTDFSDCARRAEAPAGGLSRFFLGSVADRIVRLAPCPVMTVRGDGGAVGPRPAASAA